MDNEKTGCLIRRLRMEKKLTQKQLSEQLGLTDKAVSKWERGYGAPETAYLAPLASLLGISTETLLEGNLDEELPVAGNLKKMSFFVCPVCGNVIFSLESADISCCSRRLKVLPPIKAEPEKALRIAIEGDEIIISSDHPMTREDYISFVAIVSSDTCLVRKLYPEWNLDIHMPLAMHHGIIFHYSRNDGLLYQSF